MDDFILRYLAYMALGLVVLGIALALRKVMGWRDVRGLPDADRRLALLARLRTLRAEGANHQECTQFLRREGLRKGVASGMLIDLEREQPADVDHPQVHTWNGYRFEYPGNWKVAPLFEGGGDALGISVEGFGSSMVMFVQLLDDDAFDDMLTNQRKQIREPDDVPLEHWGTFSGEGRLFAGPHKKLRLPVEVGVFRPDGTSIPMAIVQYHAVEEQELVDPGFELIRRTLAS